MSHALLFLPLQVNGSQGCPKDWEEYGNSCYLFVTIPFYYGELTWKESRADCKLYGAELVSIQNSLEAHFIRQQIIAISGQYDDHFWIGLYRSKATVDPKEGWEWSDGSNFTNPLPWHLNEPKQNKECGVLTSSDDWLRAADCVEYYSKICKKKKGDLLALFHRIS